VLRIPLCVVYPAYRRIVKDPRRVFAESRRVQGDKPPIKAFAKAARDAERLGLSQNQTVIKETLQKRLFPGLI